MSEFQISKEDWNQIQAYASIAFEKHKCEIGGMMVMDKTEDGDWLMHDPVILKQEISYAQCDIDKEALAVYYNDAMAKHPGCRFVWWHSHHNMKAFWSGTDEKTINETKSADFTVSLVINLKGQYELRVKWFEPCEAHIDTELEIVNNLEAIEHSQEMIDDVAKLCSKPKAVTVGTVGGYGNYRHYNTYINGWGKQTTFLKQSNDDSLDVEKMLEIPDATFSPEQSDALHLEKIIEFIDELNNKFCCREIQYKDWREYVRQANRVLENSKWSLTEFKSKKLDNLILHAHSTEFIKYDNKPLDANSIVTSDEVWGCPF
tara:strand:- start:3505 stop:4455 length:951 start_codon:yes stop_codon:yes gene_type:complete